MASFRRLDLPGAPRLWVRLLLKRLRAQGQAAHDALLALKAVVDNIGIDVVDLGRDDIAVEHLGALFACERHDGVWSATPPPMMIFCGA